MAVVATLHKAFKLQGRTTFQGLPIAIENKKGTYRCGTDPDGHEWKTYMHFAYGYIALTQAGDGDAVDCYLGPNLESEKVFVVHQMQPWSNMYDEDKCMLGFNSRKEAKAAYLKQYDKPGYFGSIEEWNVHDFVAHIRAKKNFLTGVRK